MEGALRRATLVTGGAGFIGANYVLGAVAQGRNIVNLDALTYAGNLVALAQGGNKVFLVDCDLRRPQLHRFFDLPSEPGLTNGLLGEGGWKAFVRGRTEVERLSVLTAGVLSPNPAEFRRNYEELL